jgi:predicted alpha-1,6-mannanase (GH76 family)
MTADPTPRGPGREAGPEGRIPAGAEASATRAGRRGRERAAGPGSPERAELAAYSVSKLFVHRLLGVPGTLLARTSVPPRGSLGSRLTRWNYWWQAQLLDAMVDAGQRDLALGRSSDAERWLDNGTRLLRGIRWHNLGTYANPYYDDMAWLTLAAQRLNAFSHRVSGRGSGAAQEVGRVLYPRLARAITPELGGGAFWNTAEEYKNTPSTAPIAVALTRAGRHGEAAALMSWLRESLFDPERGYLDGIRLTPARNGERVPEVNRSVHSYNQGTVLAAHLEHPEGDLRHAEEIVEAAARTLTVDVEVEGTTVRILDTRGGGDAGLFAGILARYLAAAALDGRLSEQTRGTARELVLATAEMLWSGRREYDPDLPLNEPGVDVSEIRGSAVAVFSPDAARHSSEALGAGAGVELSSQVQAWTILEAAWRLGR